ncbi:hypothetical protein KR200_009493 [Drosophila serrata]|nr:hypothetical protein KR200_009493 [Drosophila serrata]
MLLSGAESFMESQKPKEYLISETAKKDLMKLDKELITNLMEYSDKLKKKITQLQMIAREIREPLDAAKGMEEEYLSNPLHSFPLIRHMHQDWPHIEKFMKMPVGQDEINFLKKKLPELPASEDSKDASKAMYRLARTYNVTPWELSNGLIDGIQLGNTLTALDCFELGKLYFKWDFPEEAAQWFNITLNFDLEARKDVEVMGLHQKDLVLLLARSLTEMGEDDKALNVLEKQPDLAENHTSLLNFYKANLNDPTDDLPYLSESYSKLCQSSQVPSPSRLHCRYNSTTSPFLILAPLKMEEISLDPYIVVYHDILSVKQTEKIIRFGEPKMEPTYIFTPKLGAIKHKGRTAVGSWLYSEDFDLPDSPFHNLFDVIRDITGLNIDDSIEIQLLKYGFGAHYGPHPDFFNGSAPDISSEGDRIATVLFYLNDAPHGGATAFTDINIKVPAERGKVLFWHNLKGETYDLDLHTIHSACPVYQGFKFGE